MEYAQKYIDFTYQNPTAYHAVKTIGKIFEAEGFTFLSEKNSWSALKPGKYYTTRSGTSLAAFVVGLDWKPLKGVGAVGCHIDSLTLKLKPVSKKGNEEGYQLLGVAPYSGGLSDKWFDRDLGYGGRVIIKKDGKTYTKLVDSTPQPIAKIASLAPHFGLVLDGPFNKETEMVPIIGYSDETDPEPTEDELKAPLIKNHSLRLLRHVAKLAGVEVADLYQLDLDLFDVQKGTIAGLDDDFLVVPRMDDKICSYAAVYGLIESLDELTSDLFSVVVLFDNEEIGSLTRQGAAGGLFEAVVERTASALFADQNTLVLKRLIYANSILLSADVTHLLDPNFVSAYLKNHSPVPNTGIAIGLDSNGNVATDNVGTALIEQIAERNGDVVQYFNIRNDSRSGGTIGPTLSSHTGVRTIDVGICQLAMHSIRAATGSKDLGLGIQFFKHFLVDWRKVYDNFGDL